MLSGRQLSFIFALSLLARAASAQVPAFALQWGSQGSAPGQFEFPSGVAVGPNGDIYVADQYNYRVQEFTPSGVFVRAWGSHGTGPGQFGLPIAIATDVTGNVFVVDRGNPRVEVFAADGTLLRIFGTNPATAHLGEPRDIAVDPAGFVDVLDGNLVFRFDSSGQFVGFLGDGSLVDPYAIAMDRNGDLFVADSYVSQIIKFGPTGALLARWGSPGSGDGQFEILSGLGVDDHGNVLAVDFSVNQIQQFTNSGAFVARWSGSEGGPGQSPQLVDVAAGPSGQVFVVDLPGCRIEEFAFAPTATRKQSWGAVKSAFR